MGGRWRGKVRRQPQDVPPARRGQAFGVVGAQIVGVRLGVGGQRPENGCLVGIHVRQGRYGL